MNDLTKDEVAFGELVLTDLSATKAAAKVWPLIKHPRMKAGRVTKKESFKQWLAARKEVTFQTVREITAKHKVDYEARINTLAEAFADSETNLREKLQIHDKLTTEEGRKIANAKESSSDNALVKIAQAAGLGAAAGARISDGQFPDLRAVFPEDKGQAGRVAVLPPLAAPSPDVGRPEVAD